MRAFVHKQKMCPFCTSLYPDDLMIMKCVMDENAKYGILRLAWRIFYHQTTVCWQHMLWTYTWRLWHSVNHFTIPWVCKSECDPNLPPTHRLNAMTSSCHSFRSRGFCQTRSQREGYRRHQLPGRPAATDLRHKEKVTLTDSRVSLCDDLTHRRTHRQTDPPALVLRNPSTEW